MFGGLALLLIPVVNGNLVRGAEQNGEDGERIVEGRAGGNAKDVAV